MVSMGTIPYRIPVKFQDASSDGASDSLLDKLNSDSDGFQKPEKSRTSFIDTVPKKTTLEPIYMFGKHSGAPWIKKQIENNPSNSSIASDLKSNSKILKPNSKIRKQLSKDEVIKDEPSPRSSDEKETNIQESKTIRTKLDADLVQQEFKTIDEMFGNI
ncbi:hypothetical protein BpHYR1_049655 [Brachionus plicatilis]|uniref:Uncharacterized protein n=1 Tax=Brachionus plicatilis TaxID=10195 RepID=A0A3M7R6A9_BRAPC|nr:hypothetical protein BpHYR1_049655 [Brachionus plicatilis]